MTKQELFENIKKKKSFLCVGLDTDITKIPKHLLTEKDPVFEFNKQIIDATKDFCIAYKPNMAFYESLGAKGWESLAKTIEYIPKDIFTIADAKRGDIGNTSKLYARAFFEQMNFDSITVAPYMGSDSVKPFLEYSNKWVILLALTSNAGAEDFQTNEFTSSENSKSKLFEKVLSTSLEWGTSENMMYVVGATRPEMLQQVRAIVPDHFLLVPGVGAQGGSLEDVCKYGMNNQCGLLVNSSRSIIYASEGKDFAEKAKEEAKKIQSEMVILLEKFFYNPLDHMTEEFLHHIWKFRLFDNKGLQTEEGELLEIITPGEHNTNAGPDFSNARIKIGDTLWAGNIEIHTNSSDWSKHNHNIDKAYDNIVLHVVYNNDELINNSKGKSFTTLTLKEKIDPSLFNKYSLLRSSKDWIPCGKQISGVDTLLLTGWLERMVVERLERKSERIYNSLLLNNNDWEETFYIHLAKNFGFKINAEPFELLLKSLPGSVLAKHKDSLLQIEALLYGQAGFLNRHFSDKYLLQLQNEYSFLQKKFKLNPIEKHLWKFLRLRPANFPTIRLSQFAGLIFRSIRLFSEVIEAKKCEDIHELFSVSASDYWQNHYTFERESTHKLKPLGAEAIDNIIINTIVPFLFAYGKQKNEDKYIIKALSFLENVKAESNSIIKKWQELGIKITTGWQSQAALELKNEYCTAKKCLSCVIGTKLLNN